jgi:two-component system, OmpR family, KDP operon response regulator KdpE
MTATERAPRVLVVDDERHVVDALQAALVGRGYEVHSALNGPLAIESVTNHAPDVVLLDLAMPGMDGVEVTRRLRSWSEVPIVVLSARTDEHQKVLALDAGADDYVTKPFGSEELLARVRAALRRARSRTNEHPVIRVDSLTIDFAARRVLRDDVEVHLTPTEFELLRLLASNPDRVLTHRYLLQAAMGPGYEDALENLRTFIAQLRRKIEPDSGRPRIIVTEPGIGYRFRPALSES